MPCVPANPIKYFSFLFDDIVNAKEIRNGEKKLEDLGIRAIDNHTFEVKLISPNAMFLNFLCLGIFFPIHKASVETLGLTYGFTPEQTIGNGAYMLKEFMSSKNCKSYVNGELNQTHKELFNSIGREYPFTELR